MKEKERANVSDICGGDPGGPMQVLLRFLRRFKQKYIPTLGRGRDFSRTRDTRASGSREMERVRKLDSRLRGNDRRVEIASSRTLQAKCGASSAPSVPPRNDSVNCPYCSSKDTVRRGLRKKKYEVQQRYLCNACQKSFVAPKAKGKQFPLKVILEGISYYNTGFTLVESCRFLKEQSGLDVKEPSLANWVKEYEHICRYSRMRPYGLKLYSPHQVIQSVRLFHRQVYEFCYHRAKMALILQEHKHARFDNLREFLEAVQNECPHQFFQDGERASEERIKFDLSQLVVREKQNFATRIAGLALQAVNDNKLRHKALQRFMLCNDSVTVATEVPVYMDSMDVEHMQEALKFKIPIKLDKVLTGHIDMLQVRNGSIHILDYKPQKTTKKQRPITQLTLYALALSRLTGLRLYDFKCAWFDENAYYEFFPLHVVYKLRDKARKEDPSQMKFEELIVEGEQDV